MHGVVCLFQFGSVRFDVCICRVVVVVVVVSCVVGVVVVPYSFEC